MNGINAIVFDTRKDIESALDRISSIISNYGYVTVADIYVLTGRKATPRDTKYGWDDFNNITVSGCDGGYTFVDIPDPLPIEYFEKNKLEDKNYESTDKMVSHPDHYQSNNGLEVIDAIEAFTDGLNGIEATDTGNIIKYACRWHKKNGIQDLEKILWYTQHLINHLKKKEIINHE